MSHTLISLVLLFASGIFLMGEYLLRRIRSRRIRKERRRKNAIKRKVWKEETDKAERKRIEIDQQIAQGVWKFPVDRFASLCRTSGITGLDREYDYKKAMIFAQQLIREASADISFEKCGHYLKKEKMESFLMQGMPVIQETNARELEKQKIPRDSAPKPEERRFIRRVEELSVLSGNQKRISMLTDLLNAYDGKIEEIPASDRNKRKSDANYAASSQKNQSRSTMPILFTEQFSEYDEVSEMKTENLKIGGGVGALYGNSKKLLEDSGSASDEWNTLIREREVVVANLMDATGKVCLSNPSAADIWRNIKICGGSIHRKSNGILKCTLEVKLKAPFVLDVPENASMVVDGAIRGEVWFENRLVDVINFPLPLYGIPVNAESVITLNSMCGRSVEYNGEYTLKLDTKQNLWIMEA